LDGGIFGFAIRKQNNKTKQHITQHITKQQNKTTHHITSHHITTHHITSHHITTHHKTPHHISSHQTQTQTQTRHAMERKQGSESKEGEIRKIATEMRKSQRRGSRVKKV